MWGPEGPALVDWEFWRMGDPAEDLAYLAEVNRLPDPVLAAVARRLRPARGRGRRRRLAGADGRSTPAGWYLREGMEAEARPLLERGAELLA